MIDPAIIAGAKMLGLRKPAGWHLEEIRDMTALGREMRVGMLTKWKIEAATMNEEDLSQWVTDMMERNFAYAWTHIIRREIERRVAFKEAWRDSTEP